MASSSPPPKSGPEAYVPLAKDLVAQSGTTPTDIDSTIDDIAHALSKGMTQQDVLAALARGIPTFKLRPGPFLPFVLKAIKQVRFIVICFSRGLCQRSNFRNSLKSLKWSWSSMTPHTSRRPVACRTEK